MQNGLYLTCINGKITRNIDFISFRYLLCLYNGESYVLAIGDIVSAGISYCLNVQINPDSTFPHVCNNVYYMYNVHYLCTCDSYLLCMCNFNNYPGFGMCLFVHNLYLLGFFFISQLLCTYKINFDFL